MQTFAQQPVVCVVDGDPAVRDSLQYLCDSNGQRTLGFSTRSAFLRMFDAANDVYTKCVICEAQLPDGSGVELYKELKRRGVTVPFALMFSRNPRMAVQAARRLGIEYVWSKPLVDRARLIAFLGEV
jgi:FixJ family two-component response regulator